MEKVCDELCRDELCRDELSGDPWSLIAANIAYCWSMTIARYLEV